MDRREHEPVRLGDALSSWMGPRSTGMSAGAVWNRIVGPRERLHTRGVYLERRGDKPPILHVYVDSSALLQDFRTNGLIYEQQMAQEGLPVERIVFALSRQTGVSRETLAAEMANHAPEPDPLDACPPLSPEEAAYVERTVEGVAEPLRSSMKRAMEASLRRSKRNTP